MWKIVPSRASSKRKTAWQISRQFYRLGLIAFLICLLSLANSQEDYYPARIGLSWTYSNGETQEFDREQDGGLVLVHYLGGSPVSEDYLRYGENGVHTSGTAVGGQVLSYTPPLMVYPPAPMQVGQSWRSTTQIAGLEISLNAEVVAVRGIETPVGRFNALHIRQQTITNTGGQTNLELFFVPSIGVVRWVTQDGTVIDLIEKNF